MARRYRVRAALAAAVLAAVLAAGCGRLGEVGRAPGFTAIEGSPQHHALYAAPLPALTETGQPTRATSLWSVSSAALLGDRRAARRGDILTVVIAIDDRAEIRNATKRARDGRTRLGIPQLVGLPQRIDADLPSGASLATAVDVTGDTDFAGTGAVRRAEQLELRLAATVVDELPNGVLRIEGQQEVRVNNEIRELTVGGFVRPADISRLNEIKYDKIAGARISYGGRGQISDVQQPRYGQQIADLVLPF